MVEIQVDIAEWKLWLRPIPGHFCYSPVQVTKMLQFNLVALLKYSQPGICDVLCGCPIGAGFPVFMHHKVFDLILCMNLTNIGIPLHHIS